MQEGLLAEAAAAGASVLRPAKLRSLRLWDPPAATILVDGSEQMLHARLIVGADGRESQVARLAGFQRLSDPEELYSTGLLVEGEMNTGDAVHFLLAPTAGCSAVVCPVASGRYRLYLFRHAALAHPRLSGAADFPAALDAIRRAGVPADWLDGARLAGPLATFDGSHRWIDHPHVRGVVLVGDAAAASDPAWGSGLSRTLRDVRLLRDALIGDEDWTRAADAYAEQHDQFWARLRDLEHLNATALMSPGPPGLKRRIRTLELVENIPEFETWTYGPEASCPNDIRTQLLAPLAER